MPFCLKILVWASTKGIRTEEMLYLVYGGSGSGKSEFAENLSMEIAGGQGALASGKKIYIATMAAAGFEARERIERHKKQREGKGFFTIEKERNLEEILKDEKKDFSSATALLECMSNFLANEMFSSESQKNDEDFYMKKIVFQVKALAAAFKNLVIVSNNVFEDGLEYDPLTKKYMRLLAALNSEIAAFSDRVFEIIAGIPVKLK